MKKVFAGYPTVYVKKIPYIAIAFLVVIGLYISAEYGEKLFTRGIIFEGVYCEGIHLGGRRVEDALRLLDDYEENVIEQVIQLRFEDKTWYFDPADAGIGLNKEAIIKEAYSLGRSGDIFERLTRRQSLMREGQDIGARLSGNEGALREFIRAIANEIYIPVTDARFEIDENRRISIIEERIGRVLSREETFEKVMDALTGNEKEIDIDVKMIYPGWTRDQLFSLGIDGPISSFTTYFDVTNVERAHNIHLGAKSLSGIILSPGEILSFNRSVGPRSQNRGYMAAPVIFGDELIPDFGGGICQVSTTLYNAALLAEMEIVERRNHSRPVEYVPLGRDATVAYDYIDLKIKNNLGEHLLIWAFAQEGAVTVEIYGRSQRSPLREIDIISEVVKTYDPPKIREEDPEIPAGTSRILREGSSGYDVRVWRVTREGGKELRKLLSFDHYRPVPTIERIGIKQDVLLGERL